MIAVYQHADPGTATPDNSAAWIAECTIDGNTYTARSRRGAPYELARALVAAGIPDGPMRVYSAPLAGYATYPSMHAAALYTITESARSQASRVRWRENDFWAEKAPGETLADLPGAGAADALNGGVPVGEASSHVAGSETLPCGMSQVFHCEVCSAPLAAPRRGPDPRFCGAACRKRASRAAQLKAA